MKIYGTILTLTMFHQSVWNGSAFSPHAPKTKDPALVLFSALAGNGASAQTMSGFPRLATPGQETASPTWKIANTPQKAVMPLQSKEEVWEKAPKVTVQGGSLRTCSFNESVDRVQVLLKTEGRPLNSNVELWQGPDNTPQKINVYIEDGSQRQFRAIIETPRGSNAVCIRNTAHMEFPLAACVDVNVEDGNGNPANPVQAASGNTRIIQGGAVHTTPFAPSVKSVQVMLKTDGRPLNARIELLQGPNNNKQVMELYIEDGMERPFYAIIDTPGSGNVVRIVNTSTVEFPMSASVTAYEEDISGPQFVAGGGSGMVWSD
jgi:hypothetical protein